MHDSEEQPQEAREGEPRKLTEEELQKSVERLSRSTREPVKLKPLVEPRYISQEELDKSIKHLYDDSMERRQREREEIERQMQAAMTKDAKQTSAEPLSREEEEQMVRRLYEETLARKNNNLEELRKQELIRQKGTLHTRTWTAEEEKDIADRLYRGGMERERNKHIALYEKYVLARHPKPVQRSRADLAASADKMTKGEGLLS